MTDEKIVVQGVFKKNKAALIVMIVSIVAFVGAWIWAFYAFENLSRYFSYGFGISGYNYYHVFYDSFGEYFSSEFFGSLMYGYILIASVIAFVVSIILKKVTEGGELTVTESRVYGKASGGKTVVIPLNQITRIMPTSTGAEIFTIVGGNKFSLLENKSDVLNAIQYLLSGLQKNGATQAAPAQATTAGGSEADKLKQFKELLDSGIISQEEYDSKKKEILGL